MQHGKQSTSRQKKADPVIDAVEKSDVVSFMAGLMLKSGKLTKEEIAAIDEQTRFHYGKSPAYVLQKSPTMRQSIRDAVGTYDEIAAKFKVSRVTVWRVRKGR